MIKRSLNLSPISFSGRRARRERVLLREREGVFYGALDLREDRGRQSSKFFKMRCSSTALICSVTAFEAKVRRAVPFAITT